VIASIAYIMKSRNPIRDAVSGCDLRFCRFTQLGLLRLLPTTAVMSDEVMTQPQAWAAYDRRLKIHESNLPTSRRTWRPA
jgi:hypothetical protein